MEIFRRKNYLQIDFSDGRSYCTDDCTDEQWDFLAENYEDEDAIRKKFLDEELYTGKKLLEKVRNSDILTLRGNSVYMLSVSELSIPEDFVSKIIEAEENNDELTLKAFKNFWTLVSLNPDSRVRNNLFWFIRKWDMQITVSGLIVAYRNAEIKAENNYSSRQVQDIINAYYRTKYVEHIDPNDVIYITETGDKRILSNLYNDIVNNNGSPIYTDRHTHSTEIRLGQPVRIPREECDADQEHSCSRGLHCGAKGWLKKGYYGDVGLMVLVNPANVVAVPTIDDYGKMRTCEYFPVAIIDFDENGDIVENTYSLHDDIAYLQQLSYNGDINNIDVDGYEISHTGITREEMYDGILNSLKEFNA